MPCMYHVLNYSEFEHNTFAHTQITLHLESDALALALSICFEDPHNSLAKATQMYTFYVETALQ